jgi:hypothetical protein
LICYPSLDRRKVEFSGFRHAGGLDAPAGVMREAGGLLPMVPCGRSSLYLRHLPDIEIEMPFLLSSAWYLTEQY